YVITLPATARSCSVSLHDALPISEKYEEAFDMLYWLEKEAFHPMEQLHTLKQLLDVEEEAEVNHISIQNINGHSKYFYTPYELRSEEHTSELQSRFDLVCRLLLEK